MAKRWHIVQLYLIYPYVFYHGIFETQDGPIESHGPLTRYVKLWVSHAQGIPRRFSPPTASKETAGKRSRHASRHVRHARAVMHVGIANPRWRGKRSQHSRRMRNQQFYVSGKRPIANMTHWVSLANCEESCVVLLIFTRRFCISRSGFLVYHISTLMNGIKSISNVIGMRQQNQELWSVWKWALWLTQQVNFRDRSNPCLQANDW